MAAAITWNIKITVLDLSKKAVSVVATRTDSIDPTNPKTYSVLYAVIDTAAQKVAVMDNIWTQHQAATSNENVVSSLIGALEADAKSNLEARE